MTALKWPLAVVGLFAGMCGMAYLLAAIVIDRILRG